MAVVVSFCRPKTERHLVAVIEKAGGEIRWLDFAPHRLYSARGIAHHEGSLFVVGIAAGGSGLAVFDTIAWKLRGFSILDGIADVHSICMADGAIIAASTGSDKIVRITDNGTNHTYETLWSPSSGEHDLNHVNAVCFHKGELYCCAFGPKSSDRWKSAQNGYIYNITRNK
ncbi:MAG: hypothetical protein JO233_06900, partial [Candidatus Eremiobacteraeota bacterium]|nr:hypothetical protein [Candidatus Eremiobacteraeota bacterium]